MNDPATILQVLEWFWAVISDPLNGMGYQIWSGILGATAIFSGVWLVTRKHNCHEPWCWRIGRFPVDGTPYVVCHRHHPGLEGDKVQPGHIGSAHLHHRSTKTVEESAK